MKVKKILFGVFVTFLICALFVACDVPTDHEQGTHQHSWSEWSIIKDPSCTEEGSTKRFCQCGEFEIQGISITKHTYGEWKITTPPTCIEKGSERRDCDICDYFEVRDINANGHTNKEAVVENKSDATCITSGSYDSVIYCSICNDEVSRKKQTISRLGHDPSIEWIVDIEPTCIENGSKSHHCSRCSSKIDITEIEANGHSYQEWIETLTPTCAEKGAERRDCDICEHFETRDVEATGNHTEVIDVAIAPTYTTRGKTEGRHCSVCQNVLIEQQDISSIWDGKTVIAPSQIVNIDGTNYYKINSAEELAYLSTNVGYNFILTCHIVLNEKIEYDEYGNLLSDPSKLNIWIPIKFVSLFDGNNYTITGVYSVTYNNENGLFGDNGQAEIRNLHVINSYIEGGRYTGGIAGYVKSIENCSFEGVVISHHVAENASTGGLCGSVGKQAFNCTNYGTVIGKNKVGGIAGGGKFENCTNYGNITSSKSCGGIGGGSAYNCQNYGTITGNSGVGGITMSATGSTGTSIKNCTNYGDVYGIAYVGGIAGSIGPGVWHGEGSISNCRNYGAVSGTDKVGGIVGSYSAGKISTCNNEGNITGDSNVGGIVGFVNIFTSPNYNITNCYYLKNDSTNASINGISNFEDKVGVCEGKDSSFFEEEE